MNESAAATQTHQTPAKRGRPRKLSADTTPTTHRKRGGQIGNRGNRTDRRGRGINHNGGRPRIGADVCAVKINIAITTAQRDKLAAAANAAGTNAAGVIRALIDAIKI